MTQIRRTFGAAPLLDRAALTDTQRAALGDADNTRRVWFRLVTTAIDRHGTIILPDGVDVSTHRTNPVFLWLHQSSSRGSALKVGEGADSFAVSLASAPQPPPDVVIGQVVGYEQDATRLDICVLFDDDEMADLCYRKVRKGFLRAVSIGCNVIEETTRDVDGVKVPVYVRSELLEASLVIIPSNREALQLDRGAATMALRAIEAPMDVDDAPSALATSIAGDVAADTLLRAAAEAVAAPAEARGADGAPPPVEVARADGDAPLPADAEPLAPGEARDAVPAPMAGDSPPDNDADERAARQLGVAVCLYPIAGTVDALAVAGGKAASDLHCTLAHVPPEGLPEGWEDRLTMILRRTADRYPILRGVVSGIGRLATDDGDVVVALPDMPRLAEVAAVVRDEMYWAEFRPSRDHGWLPHITLAKIAGDADLPVQRLDALPLVFDALTFVAGGARHNFNFATPDSVSAGDANDLPAGVRTMRAALADCEATAAQLRTEIGKGENAPIDRREADPYLARDVQTAGDASAAAVLTAQVEDPKERTMPISMSPECRWAMRTSIAHAMDGAELHSAMADIAPEGHRTAHRSFAMDSLARAEGLHKLYRDAFRPDEDEGGTERKAPELKDTELKARFAEVAALCGKLPRTAAQVLRQYAGTDKPDDAEVELMALRADRADLVKTRTAARTEQRRTEGEQRDALIAKYMEPGVALITPADAKTMRGLDPATDAVVGEPWSPNRIEVFAQKRMASGGGPAADLVRTAPLANAGGAAATPTPGATPLQPGNTPAAVDTPAAPSLVRMVSGRGKDVTHLAQSAIANVPGLSEEDLRRSMAALTSTGVQPFAQDVQKIAVK